LDQIQKDYFIDALQPPKQTKRRSAIKIVDPEVDSFPIVVQPVVQEETVETFEFEKLGSREIFSYEMPNFKGQIREVGHRSVSCSSSALGAIVKQQYLLRSLAF
jgi:hypothetical protein